MTCCPGHPALELHAGLSNLSMIDSSQGPSVQGTPDGAVALLRRDWQGRLPLCSTCRIIGVAGNMTFAAALTTICVFGGADAVTGRPVVCMASLIRFIRVVGAIWRAAAARGELRFAGRAAQ